MAGWPLVVVRCLLRTTVLPFRHWYFTRPRKVKCVPFGSFLANVIVKVLPLERQLRDPSPSSSNLVSTTFCHLWVCVFLYCAMNFIHSVWDLWPSVGMRPRTPSLLGCLFVSQMLMVDQRFAVSSLAAVASAIARSTTTVVRNSRERRCLCI